MQGLPVSPARLGFTSSVLMLLSLGASAFAQADSRSLPDDPGYALTRQSTPTAPAPNSGSQSHEPLPPLEPTQASLEGKQTKRILGIIPNFRSVSVNEKLPAESVKDKFKESSEDAFDYSDFIFVAILAGISQIQNSYPEFHQGAAGYGRYYWHNLADQVDEDYQVEFIFPAVLHQDSRYYTLGHGGFFKRTGYAFSRILITCTDAGKNTFNASEIIGAGASAGISDLYYPSPERTWTKTGQRWELNVGLDGATFIFKEFWPDINNKFFHQKD